MILDNISRALRTQNWLAAGVEFVIVISGVVIGFQINAWGSDRQMRAEERVFVGRLLGEIEVLSEERNSISRMAAQNRARNASVLEKLSAQSDALELDADECAFIIVSNLIAFDPADLPALEEMSASGDRSFMRDATLSAAVSNYIQTREARREIARELRSKTIDLSRDYPDLIRQEFAVPEEGLTASDIRPARLAELRVMTCDLAGMRANGEFLNGIANNTGIMALYAEAVSERTTGSLATLQSALEAYGGR